MSVHAREQAAAGVAAVVAERDTIQQNLLELDNSFGKRLLAGAKLAGETRKRWDAAEADMATLWQVFTAYSAVVDRAARMAVGARRLGDSELAEIRVLLHGESVVLPRASSALSRGDLTDPGRTALTMVAAVQDMRRAFARVAEVLSAAEVVWNAMADGLQEVDAALVAAGRQADGLADDSLSSALALARTDLAQLREVTNSDPLALWDGRQVDLWRLSRLRERAAAAVSRVAELAALREQASQRIAAVTAAVAAASQACQDALAAHQRARAKIASPALSAPPEAASLAGRLAALSDMTQAGRWSRLAAELDLVEKQASSVAREGRDAEQAAVALLDRRDELRGLLDAYQARAAKLGAAEVSELTTRYDRARELLWLAPCDIAAAADAVSSYQQAVLELSRRGHRR